MFRCVCVCVCVCVPHAGRPSTAKHSLRTRKRKPLRRRMAIRRCMRTCVGMCMARGPLRGRVRVGAACAEEVSMHEVHRSARRGNKGGGGRRPPRSGMKHELRRGRQGVGGDAAHRKRAMVSLRPQCVCQNLTSCSSLLNVAIGPFDRRTPSRVSRLQERCKGCRFATAAL